MIRVLTAIVLAPIVLVIVFLAPDWLFVPLLVALAVFGAREFYDLAQAAGLHPYRWVGFTATAALVMRLNLNWANIVPDPVLVVIVLLLACVCLAQRSYVQTAIADAGVTLLGIIYPGLLVGLLGSIRSTEEGPTWLLLMLLSVWVGDMAALYIGKLIGKHPMAPVVSPKKTWEGAAASLVAAVGICIVIGLWANLGPETDSTWHSILEFGALGVVLNVAAQLGDLLESVFKRSAQVKDSGHLLPGHGGILDRIDAMLLATPVLWLFLRLSL